MGPLTRTVSDAALYLDCTAGHHPWDPSSLPKPENSFLNHIDDLPKKLRIAFSPDLGYAQVDKDIAACVEKAVAAFSEMGHEVELWSGTLPDTGEVWTHLACVDIFQASSNRISILRVTGVLKIEPGGLGKGEAFLMASMAASSSFLFRELFMILISLRVPSEDNTN